ncbi:MAG: glycosyltransferase [Actinomycetota bacterium]|nr:glycosyltransferase [Actinomycetota bacterium]
MTAVHQLVPSVVPYDATSGHTLQVQRALRDAGFESEIFALAVHRTYEGRVHLVHQLEGASPPGTHLLYQFSSVSELADTVLARRHHVAIDYHNVSPPALFAGWDLGMARSLQAGQLQLAQLARAAALGIGDSAFDVADLERLGVPSTAVVPVLVDMDALLVEPDPRVADDLARRRDAGGPLWLFVGSIAPHKAQHRLVQALAEHRRIYDSGARLVLVGRTLSGTYQTALRRLVRHLGLDQAVELPGAVDQHQLAAYFAGADVFVSASTHEGFGVPLLEAMAHDVPVVALAAGAVAETVGPAGLVLGSETAGVAPGVGAAGVASATGAGVVLGSGSDASRRPRGIGPRRVGGDLDTDAVSGGVALRRWAGPQALAAAVARVLGDEALRRHLQAAGRRRVAHFSLQRSRAALVEAVTRWVSA